MQAIPERPEQIDAAWLTTALSHRHPGVAVSSVEVVERHEATNAHARLCVEYHAAAGAPASIFCKLLPAEAGRREAIAATGMGIAEARFYDELAAGLSLRVPAIHAVSVDEATGAFVVLMEDLVAGGCGVPDGTVGVSVEAAAAALEDLAAMHLHFHDVAVRGAQAGWVKAPGPPSEYGTSRLQLALDHHRDRLTDSFAELADLYVRECVAIHQLWGRGPHTLIHGDAHIGNLFDDGGRIGFLDWGLVNVSTPLRDVSYFLAMALSIEDRRRDERSLLRHWLDVWNAGCDTALGFDEAWLAHRLHAAYTVPACCQIVTFPDGVSAGRQAFSEAFLARAEAAIDDLEARAALRVCGGP